MTASSRASLARALRHGTAVLAPVVAAAVLVLGVPSAALAHDGLVGTSPASAGTAAVAPDSVELAFTGEPLPLGTLVAVTGPDGATVSDGPAEIVGTRVVQPLTGDLPAGPYRVDWRSTSSDGHALTGTFDFTVTPAAGRGPAEAPAAGATSGTRTSTTSTDGSVAPVWPAAGAVVLVTLGALLATRVRRRG